MRTIVLNVLLITLCTFLIYHATKTNIEEPDYTYALFDTHDTQPSYTIGDYGWIENFE
jgi:hypothetical protein